MIQLVCEPNLDETPASTPRAVAPLTVIVPAYNEEGTIGDTLESLLAQTLMPAQIIVVNDCSTDRTEIIARKFGVTVLRPPKNTGTKAGAQNFALRQVQTGWVMAIDADTVLAPDAIEKLAPALENGSVAAACGLFAPACAFGLGARPLHRVSVRLHVL